MNICIIGATGHAGYVLNGLRGRTDAQLVGIAPGSIGEDVDNLVQSSIQAGHDVQEFSNYIEMLDELKPDIVAVACHFHDHAAVALEVLKRGIHLFVEKPIATTLEDLASVKQAFEQSDVQLAGMFGTRYLPWFLTAHQLMQAGAIGEVRLMNAQKSYRLGNRGNVYRSRETYGGTIPWVGSHAIDWMYWLGGEPFQSVYASHSTRANDGHGELEATALCHFTFANEVFGSVNIDYLRPKRAPSHDDDRIRIAGSEGVLEVRGGRVYLINGDEEGEQEVPLLPERESFADFLDHVQGKGICLVSAEDAFVVTEACLRARLSADEHRVVWF